MGVIESFRMVAAAVAVAALAGCASNLDDLDGPVRPLGDFYLGHNVVVAANVTRGPLSREASNEDLETAIREAIDRRFRRFDGDRLYHIAISVDGYVLAQPGIPIVAAPRSALIFGVTIWDDARETKLNETPHRITVLEDLSGETLVGSGLTRTAEEQLASLAYNAARATERWMRENMEWFTTQPPTVAAAAD